jgi:hypothetical protein
LCDLLTAQVERHGRGSDDIGVVAVDIDVPRLAERDAVARSPEMLARRPALAVAGPPRCGDRAAMIPTAPKAARPKLRHPIPTNQRPS